MISLRRHLLSRRAVFVAAAISLTTPDMVARAEPPLVERDDVTVRLDFKEIPLGELVIFISQITEENFIIMDRDLRDRTVTIYAPRPVPAKDAFGVLITALKIQGLEVERSGEFWIVSAP